MIKRTSLVWPRAGLGQLEFRQLWLGEHATIARRLPGLREYSIDFVTEGPAGAPAGIATVRFNDRAAVDAAFGIPDLRADLERTRAEFAERVEVLFVDETFVVHSERKDQS